MKKVYLLLVVAWLCQVAIFAQKKYEMVVEKTDGTEVVVNVEDIIRTYFREKSGNPDNPEVNPDYAAKILGKWDLIRVQGYYVAQGPDSFQGEDLSEEEVFEFYSDGTLQYYYYENHKLVKDGSGYTYKIEGDTLLTFRKGGKSDHTYTIKELSDNSLTLSEIIETDEGQQFYRELIFTKL